MSLGAETGLLAWLAKNLWAPALSLLAALHLYHRKRMDDKADRDQQRLENLEDSVAMLKTRLSPQEDHLRELHGRMGALEKSTLSATEIKDIVNGSFTPISEALRELKKTTETTNEILTGLRVETADYNARLRNLERHYDSKSG